jgi:hypothetical protein
MYIDRIPASRFRLKKFIKSRVKNKKYTAIIEDIKTRREYKVPFGDVRYEQYRDTALGLYRQLDHGDKQRRLNYLARHEATRKKKWSASWFSSVYLWAGPRD